MSNEAYRVHCWIIIKDNDRQHVRPMTKFLGYAAQNISSEFVWWAPNNIFCLPFRWIIFRRKWCVTKFLEGSAQNLRYYDRCPILSLALYLNMHLFIRKQYSKSVPIIELSLRNITVIQMWLSLNKEWLGHCPWLNLTWNSYVSNTKSDCLGANSSTEEDERKVTQT